MLAPLPEGEGLAAKYPGDAGLANDPAVVFADDFEEAEGIVLEPAGPHRTGHRWDQAWGLVRLTQDPEGVHSGRQAIRVTHSWPRSHGAEKHFDPGYDRLFLRYYMKYHKDYPGCHHTGMALFGAMPGINLGSSTGVRPDGRNHFTMLVDTMPPSSGEGFSTEPPGYVDIYCYHMDQGRKWGDILYPTGDVYPAENKGMYGPDFVPRPNLMAERGRWHCYELMVQCNTPGERDGRVAFWLDGKLAGDFPNLRLRSIPSLKINYVIIVSYSSSVRPNVTHWYDDIVAATEYIGPQVKPVSGLTRLGARV